MKKFIILTDTCCDMGADLRKKYDIEYLNMYIVRDGKEIPVTLDWTDAEHKAYYDSMREGARYSSVQVPVVAYEERFEKAIKDGFDVLSISVSSGLSGSVNASILARASVLEKYPDAKIICIDTLRASFAQAILIIEASKMRAAGKTMEEIAAWIEANKMYTHQIGSVETLTYLKRAGRITGSAAFMGNMLNIKPIIVSDITGKNKTIAKFRGRVKAIQECIKAVKERITNAKDQTIYICNADCYEEMLEVKQMLLDEVGCKDVYINHVCPIIGSTVGPGMFGIYFTGVEVTDQPV